MRPRTLLVLILLGALGFWLVRAMLPAGPAGVERVDPYAAARIYFAEGDYERALEAYRRAMEREPGDPRAAEAPFYAARCLEELDRLEEAAATYRAFVETRPEHPLAEQANRRLEAIEPGDEP